MDWFLKLDPVVQALCATLFTWSITALGATTVYIFKSINKKVFNGMPGFAAGEASLQYRNNRSDAWLRDHDADGCCTRVNQIIPH